MKRNGREASRFPLKGFLICSMLVIAAFSILMVDRAKAAPGDEHVVGAESPVAREFAYPQNSPAIAGDYVFWSDARPVPGLQNFSRIFYRDLSRPGEPERMLSAPASFTGTYKGQHHPAASGDLLVWQETVTSQSGGRMKEIRYIRLDECEEPAACPVHVVPVRQLDDLYPVGSGSRIVWEDTRNAGYWQSDIYMYDITTGLVSAVCAQDSRQSRPVTDGEWAVWVDNRGGKFVGGSGTMNDLYARNLITGEERRLSADGSLVRQSAPSIDGGRVVFSEDEGDLKNSNEIKLHDLSSGQTRLIYSGKGPDNNPYIHGDRIVWEACEDGIDQCRIWLYDLQTGVSQAATAGGEPEDMAGEGNMIAPVICGDRLVWKDSRQTAWAIFHNRIGETARVLAERHKPQLLFRHDLRDSGRTDFEPRTVNMMLDVPGTKLITPDKEIENPDAAALAANPGPEGFLNLTGSPLYPGFFDYSHPYLTQVARGGYPITAHTRVISNSEGSGTAVIQYWFCYYFNDWLNNHEGDWELVELILDENFEPEAAAYSQHGKASIKYWDEPGLETSGAHPRIYVAQGSHAGYFDNGFFGSHYHEGKLDITGDSSAAYPALDFEGLADTTGWPSYCGRWGEFNSWWPPVWLPPYVEAGPPGPACQGQVWSNAYSWAISSDVKGETGDLIVEAYGAGAVGITDSSGRYAGTGSQASEGGQIPDAEYFEREADGSRNIVINNAHSSVVGYNLSVTGSPGGSVVLSVQVPYPSAGSVARYVFEAIPLDEAGRAYLDIGAVQDMPLRVDLDGDGVLDWTKEPDRVTQTDSDFIVPAPIDDLVAIDATSDSVTLTWTATGDDGHAGVANEYEIRYSTEPITSKSWIYSPVAGQVPVPQAPGTTESMTLSGLDAGTRYYFAVIARDESWQASPLSNVAERVTLIPILTWQKDEEYWAGYQDYVGGILTVRYSMGNAGSEAASGAGIQASTQSPDSVRIVTPLPLAVGDIEPGFSQGVVMQYQVPAGVRAFITHAYGSCMDSAGRTHWFPERPGGMRGGDGF